MKPVLCFGEVLWDAFGETKKAGGAPMNVAWHLKQQGAAVSFASSVGRDASGDELADFLEQSGLYSDLVQQDDTLPTCEVTVQLDEHGHATYIIPQPVSWDNIRVTDTLLNAARNASAIIFGSLACRGTQTRDTLHELLSESNTLTVFDVNLRAPHYDRDTIHTLAARAHVVKMNEDEAELLIGKGGDLKQKIEEFHGTYHSQTICVTRGDKGAILWHDGKFYEHDGYPAHVVDTVGAGDSFLATLVAGLLNNESPDTILNRACRVGAYVAGQRGANPSYNIAEVEAL
ncbi:carbohydrate kinase [Mucilaginibacter sp. RS28]|uniref:Carbohydrate kinase n=1 Tax=Mucilaginibacter straminoryzae TaxID=2932774 RepID=A0A9X2B9A7_9SPHI|nr:carbohydrate kinase [Mucilaginibacter straminoryzae]MCJ8210404.1 carbohydrate kinase [Mucilaginibacter straminoryzae]